MSQDRTPRDSGSCGLRSFRLLVNPRSGGGAAPAAAAAVAGELRAAGARVAVTVSPGPAAMTPLSAEAVAAGEVVVSVGGDGMLCSLAGAVADVGGTLGIVPAGRGNDFARMLDLPTDAPGVARVLLEAPARPVDLISVSHGQTRRVVVGSVYAGVDARAAELVHGMRRVPRPLQYPVAAVSAIAQFRPHDYQLTLDGEELRCRAATVVVANSAFYGSGMRVAPGASVRDGTLDVVVIGARGRLATIRAFPSIYSGAHINRPEVQVRTAREVTVTATPAVAMGADGEPLGDVGGHPTAAPVRLTVLPAALRVLH